MPVYLVADIDVHDADTCAESKPAGPGDVRGVRRGNVHYPRRRGRGAGGRLAPEAVLRVRFEDRERALAWYHSPAYQEVMKLRLQSSTSNLVMIEGER
jgi:hypothetical protein